MTRSTVGALLLVTTSTLAAGLAVAGIVEGSPIDIGRAIYERNVGREPITVSIAGSEFRRADAALSCAACHGPDGEGGREGNIAAPSLVRGGIDATALRAALVQHRGPDGRPLDMTMPRYRISSGDLAALTTYVATLPGPPVPGVSADTIRVTVDPAGSGLSATGLTHLSAVVEEAMTKINTAGGLYGRRLVLALADPGTASPAFITLHWTAGTTDDMALAIRAGAREPRCGTLEPDSPAIRAALETSLRPAPASPVEPASFPAAKRSHVILSDAAASVDRQLTAAQAVDDVYLLPGTATPALLQSLGDRAHTVVSGDMAVRAKAALHWMGSGQGSPRDAIVLAAFDEGLLAITAQLREAGRRLFAGRYCQTLKAAVEQTQKLTIIHRSGVIVLPVTDRATR